MGKGGDNRQNIRTGVQPCFIAAALIVVIDRGDNLNSQLRNFPDDGIMESHCEDRSPSDLIAEFSA